MVSHAYSHTLHTCSQQKRAQRSAGPRAQRSAAPGTVDCNDSPLWEHAIQTPHHTNALKQGLASPWEVDFSTKKALCFVIRALYLGAKSPVRAYTSVGSGLFFTL